MTIEINESTTISFLGSQLPTNTTLSIGCADGRWTVFLHPGKVRTEGLSGTGPDLIRAIANLVLWLAPSTDRCGYCGEFDLHNLWKWKEKKSWKCRTCGKLTPFWRVIPDPGSVASLDDIKLFLEQNPDHPVHPGWLDLLYEVETCGEELQRVEGME